MFAVEADTLWRSAITSKNGIELNEKTAEMRDKFKSILFTLMGLPDDDLKLMLTVPNFSTKVNKRKRYSVCRDMDMQKSADKRCDYGISSKVPVNWKYLHDLMKGQLLEAEKKLNVQNEICQKLKVSVCFMILVFFLLFFFFISLRYRKRN
jgi:hypothetical protein